MGTRHHSPASFLIGDNKNQFSGTGDWTELHRLQSRKHSHQTQWSFVMSNAAAKIAFVLLLAVAAPVASFAQVARSAGGAGSGNVPISGIASGPANAGGLNNVMVDPSGIGNASRVAPLPAPRITVPVVPKFK